MFRNIFPIIVLIVLTFSAQGIAQNLDARIEGAVVDKDGAAVPDITVIARNIGTGESRKTMTNAVGTFQFPLLSPGNYSISAEERGFKRFELMGVELSAGQTVSLPPIPIGGPDETVTVDFDTAIADTSKTAVGRQVNSRDVKDLPLISRNPLNFILLQPGVSGRQVPGPALIDMSVAGLSQRVGYQIDGSNNNHFFRSGFRLNLLSETSIQEVQLMTTGYSAEFGGTAGGIVNVVTASGTNDLKGTVGVLLRPSALSAKPFAFVPGTDPNTSAYGATATIGGPIIKDRWHYFVSSEWTRRHFVVPITIASTDRDTLISSGLSPSIFVNGRSTSDTYPYLDVRTDAAVGRSTRLSFRYNYFFSDLKYSGAGGLLTTDRSFGFSGPNYALSAQAVTTFSEKFFSEFRFQIGRAIQRNAGDERTGKGPTVTIANVAGFGPDPSIGSIAPNESTVQFQENLTRIAGKHTFKFGGGINFISDRQSGQLSSQYTFRSIRDYVDALSGKKPRIYSRYQESVGTNDIPDSAIYYNTFIQDDWTFSRRAKLAIGLRYEYFDPPSGDRSAPLAISRTFNSDTNNFAPRVGFTYLIRNGKYQTVVRLGGGVHYDPPLLVMYRRALLNDGNPRYTAFTLSGQPERTWPEFPNRVGSNSFPPDLDTVAANFKTMYAIRSGVQIEQAISNDMSVTLGYINSVARQIPVYRNMNCFPTGRTLADGRPVYGTTRTDSTGRITITPCAIKMYTEFNMVKIAESGGNQIYSGMFVQLTKRFSDGFQFNANYTLSNSVDDAPEENGPAALTLSDPSSRRTDRGSSRGDLTNVFNMSFVARPTIKVSNGVLRSLVNGNQLSMIMIADSGETFNITTGDINGDGVTGSTGPDRPVGVPRNSGRLPAYWGIDARYSRYVTLSEKRSLEFFIEASNVFNLKQTNSYVAANLQANSTTSIVDPITGLLRGPIPDPSTMSPSWRESRQVQLGATMHF